MGRDDVIAKLRVRSRVEGGRHCPVVPVRLDRPGEEGNDVDLVAEFDEAKSMSLIDLVGLENRLSDLLGCKVDLARSSTLRPACGKTLNVRRFLPFDDPHECFTISRRTRRPEKSKS